MLDKDEFPDYMQQFPKEISEDLKQDLNRHIDMIIKQNRDSLASVKLELPTEEDTRNNDSIMNDYGSLKAVSQQKERRVQILTEEKPQSTIQSQVSQQSKGQRSMQPKQSTAPRLTVSRSPTRPETISNLSIKLNSKLDVSRFGNNPVVEKHSRNPNSISAGKYRSVSKNSTRKPRHLRSFLNTEKKTKQPIEPYTAQSNSKKEPVKIVRPTTAVKPYSLAHSRGSSLQRLMSPSLKPLPTAAQILNQKSKLFSPPMKQPTSVSKTESKLNSFKSSVISQGHEKPHQLPQPTGSVLLMDQHNRKSVNPIMPGLLVPVRIQQKKTPAGHHGGIALTKKNGSRMDMEAKNQEGVKNQAEGGKKTAIEAMRVIDDYQPFREKLLRSGSKGRIGGQKLRH